MDEQNNTLESFLRKTIDFYVRIARLIVKSTLKYWFYLLLFLIGFAVQFYSKYQQKREYYSASSTYYFNYLQKKYYGDKIFVLEQMASKGEISEVARILNISKDQAGEIVSIQAKNIMNGPLHDDYTDHVTPFYVQVEVKTPEGLSELQKAITNYFNTDPFVLKQIDKLRNEHKRTLAFIEREMATLDSLKSNALTLGNTGGSTALNLADLFNLSSSKFEEKEELMESIVENKAVVLLSPFQAVKVDSKSMFVKWAIKRLVLFVLLSVILSSFTYWYRHPESR